MRLSSVYLSKKDDKNAIDGINFPTMFPTMASIHKKDRSPYWYMSYPLPDGRWVKKSSKITDRTKAQKLADSFHEMSKGGHLAESQARKNLQEIFKMLNPGDNLLSPSIKDYLARWCERKKAEVTPSTLTAYQDAFRQLTTFLKGKADKDLTYLTRQDVIDFRTYRLTCVSPGTAKGSIKKLNVALNDARREGLILSNPGDGLTKIKEDKNKVNARAFTLNEVKKLTASASEEWKGMIWFAYFTGQRLSDVAQITWDKLNLEAGTFQGFKTQKTGRVTSIPFARPLVAYLIKLKKTTKGEAVFPESHGVMVRKGQSGTLSNQFRVIMVRAGLVDKATASHEGRGKGRGTRRTRGEIGFHSFRHGLTSLLKQGGTAHSVAQEIVGHDSKQVSQLYTHVGAESVRTALDAIPNPFESGKKGKTK